MLFWGRQDDQIEIMRKWSCWHCRIKWVRHDLWLKRVYLIEIISLLEHAQWKLVALTIDAVMISRRIGVSG